MTAVSTNLASAVDELTSDEWSAVSADASLYGSAQWHRFVEADPACDAW